MLHLRQTPLQEVINAFTGNDVIHAAYRNLSFTGSPGQSLPDRFTKPETRITSAI